MRHENPTLAWPGGYAENAAPTRLNFRLGCCSMSDRPLERGKAPRRFASSCVGRCYQHGRWVTSC
jgi:hypothetical protein